VLTISSAALAPGPKLPIFKNVASDESSVTHNLMMLGRSSLPPATERAASDRPSELKAPGPACSLVLVLDDDRDVSETIKELVEDQGFRAICAGDGREALTLLEKERPCLMLIDVFMPVMNGVQFLRAIRGNAELAGIPRVIMTGANDRMIGVKEDVSVLYKPVDFDALKRILHKYCGPPLTRLE
jgi:two-component system response regulator VicR